MVMVSSALLRTLGIKTVTTNIKNDSFKIKDHAERMIGPLINKSHNQTLMFK